MKRFIAMFCAFALMLSLSVAALAEESSPTLVVTVVSKDLVPAEIIDNLKTIDPSSIDLSRYDSILPKTETVISEPGAYKLNLATLKDLPLDGLVLVITAEDGTVLYMPMEQFAFGFNPETGEIILYFPFAGTFDIISPVLG